MAEEKNSAPAKNIHAASPNIKQKTDTLYAAEYLGSGTFRIVKPKRNAQKRRQSALKGTVPGARK